MRSRHAVLACVVALSAARAFAADPAQPPAAVQLARLVMPEETWNKTIEGMKAQVLQFMEATSKQMKLNTVPPEVQSQGFDDVMEELPYQQMLDLVAGVYAKHYTEAEIQDLLAFYRTPVGQKTIRIMPELAQDSMGQTLAMMQQRMPVIMEKTKARMKKYADEQKAKGKGAQPAPESGAEPTKTE